MKALLLVLLPAVALADSSVPSAARGNKAGGWQGRCQQQFELARAESARIWPRFMDGELMTGYTNGNPSFPWVEYQLKSDQYPARSNVYTAWAERSGVWGVRPWANEKSSLHPGEFMFQRSTKKIYGWVALRRIGDMAPLDDGQAAQFRKIFQKAVDACLAMEDVE
jgi:hypothetical protein